jgi:hypothetical protein
LGNLKASASLPAPMATPAKGETECEVGGHYQHSGCPVPSRSGEGRESDMLARQMVLIMCPQQNQISHAASPSTLRKDCKKQKPVLTTKDMKEHKEMLSEGFEARVAQPPSAVRVLHLSRLCKDDD